MLNRLFVAHPRAAGETYLQHQRVAFSLAGSLLVASAACLVHALVPGLCETTASRTVKALHAQLMAAQRGAMAEPAGLWAGEQPRASGLFD